MNTIWTFRCCYINTNKYNITGEYFITAEFKKKEKKC